MVLRDPVVQTAMTPTSTTSPSPGSNLPDSSSSIDFFDGSLISVLKSPDDVVFAFVCSSSTATILAAQQRPRISDTVPRRPDTEPASSRLLSVRRSVGRSVGPVYLHFYFGAGASALISHYCND